MKSITKTLIVGIALLTISGLNVYLPEVGNLFDVWRIVFSIVTFAVGCGISIRGLTEYIN